MTSDSDPGDEQPDPREILQAWMDEHTTPGTPSGMTIDDLFDHDKRVRYMQEQRDLDALYEQVDAMNKHQQRLMFGDWTPPPRRSILHRLAVFLRISD